MTAPGVTTGDEQGRDVASDALLDQLTAALTGAVVRIELGFAFTPTGTVQCASVLHPRPDVKAEKWDRVGPLLIPPVGQGRGDLLELLACLVKEAGK